MYYIKKPKNIQIIDLVTNKPLGYQNPETKEIEPVTSSFYEFLVGSLLKSEVFGKNAVTVMHAIDIKDKAKETLEEEYFSIDDEAYQLLLDSFKGKLPVVYDPAVAMQFKSFFDAIKNATQDEPVKELKE